MSEFPTIDDIAKEVNRQYSEFLELKGSEPFEKDEKSNFFLGIIERLFSEYREYFGYSCDEISKFKSSVVIVQNRIRRRVAIYYPDPIRKLEFPNWIKRIHIPKENEGEIFLDWQINEFGLNPDSY